MRREQAFLTLAFLAITAAARAQSAPDRPLGRDGPKFITCATLDKTGALWVGSENDGLRVYVPAQESWTEVPGIADRDLYALACDRKGRIWAGHLNHGVTVVAARNGEYQAKNYNHFGSPAGPLGARVYAIAVSPKDGDVWMATEMGLTRYSEADDTWRHYTRGPASGALPTEQFRGIAFDSAGDIYLASATEGIVIGRVADDFAKWEVIKGSDDMPLIAHGPGLPTSAINCITTDARGIIYAGTQRGLAVSGDHGKSWRFVRGKDWPELARGSYAGVPPHWSPPGEALLNEDWVTALNIDGNGRLWVGFRKAGYQLIDPTTSESLLSAPLMPPELAGAGPKPVPMIVTAVGLSVEGRALVTRYGGGAFISQSDGSSIPAPAVAVAAEAAALPSGAKPVTARQFDAMFAELAAMNKPTTKPAYLGEDWETEGDWVGRYGRQFAAMNGLGLSTREFTAEGYRYSIMVGPHFGQQGVYGYVDSIDNPSRRVLYDPTSGKRAHGENNDGSFSEENYPASAEGPDLWVRLALPQGAHRISLYFMNIDGQSRANAFRDYLLELRQGPKDQPMDDNAENLSLEERFALGKLPVLARARVSWFRGGVYESFLVREAGVYWIKVARNHSFVGKINGVFVDRLDLPPDKVAKAFTFHAENSPPVVKPESVPAMGAAEYAYRMWTSLDSKWACEGSETVLPRDVLEAYRVTVDAADDPALGDLLRLGRWKAHLWTQEDRDSFENAMERGFANFKRGQN
jgi:hypothetical protein